MRRVHMELEVRLCKSMNMALQQVSIHFIIWGFDLSTISFHRFEFGNTIFFCDSTSNELEISLSFPAILTVFLTRNHD